MNTYTYKRLTSSIGTEFLQMHKGKNRQPTRVKKTNFLKRDAIKEDGQWANSHVHRHKNSMFIDTNHH